MGRLIVVQMLATGTVRVLPTRIASALVLAGLAVPVLHEEDPCVLLDVQTADPQQWRTR
jgi:hypothetical protein